MKTKNEEFEVLVPNLDGTTVAERVKVSIPLKWDEELQEWLLTPEAHQIIEDTKARHMGLLLPAQFKELRERYGYTQKEMGELFQVGEKSWTRWESGKHRPSRSNNLPIRALYDGAVSVNYLLKRAGKPVKAESDLALQVFQEFSRTWKTPETDWTNLVAHYFAAAAKPVQVHCKPEGTGTFVAQLLKLVQDNPGPAEHLLSEAVPSPRHRRGMPPPTHAYPQPRLTTPTVA